MTTTSLTNVDTSREWTVVIRCALQSFKDKTVICPADWTVWRIKEHLRDVCDDSPEPERQRLIYSGKCLLDNERVCDVLQRNAQPTEEHATTATPYVMHLVYTPTAEKLRLQREEQDRQSVLRQRRTDATAAAAAQAAQQSAATTLPQSSVFYDTAQQQYMHQMYNQYMANYANYVQQLYGMNMAVQFGGSAFQVGHPAAAAVGGFGFAYPPVPTGANLGDGAAPVVAADQVDFPVAGDVAAAAQAPQEQLMNAQGGIADDMDDVGERDWLDNVYKAFRFGLFLMILWFYSSIDRMLFVMLCGFLMWAARGGILGRRQAQQQQQQNQQNENNPQPAVAAAAPEQEADPDESEEARRARLNSDTSSSSSSSDESVAPVAATVTPPTVMEPSAWTVFWSTGYTFITSFFASLIPDQPPPINVN